MIFLRFPYGLRLCYDADTVWIRVGYNFDTILIRTLSEFDTISIRLQPPPGLVLMWLLCFSA